MPIVKLESHIERWNNLDVSDKVIGPTDKDAFKLKMCTKVYNMYKHGNLHRYSYCIC